MLGDSTNKHELGLKDAQRTIADIQKKLMLASEDSFKRLNKERLDPMGDRVGKLEKCIQDCVIQDQLQSIQKLVDGISGSHSNLAGQFEAHVDDRVQSHLSLEQRLQLL